jgi:hypothetical protein
MTLVSAGVGGLLPPVNCVEQRSGSTRVERADAFASVRCSDAVGSAAEAYASDAAEVVEDGRRTQDPPSTETRAELSKTAYCDLARTA